MTLVVRDEEDILAANLDYHLSRGIDHIIATDHRSEDATPDILDRYQARGQVTWHREEDSRFRQGHWMTSMARMAVLEFDADWIIHNDADEFWWPRGGQLKQILSALPQQVGSLGAPRFNYLPSEEPGPFWDSMTLRDERSENPIGRPLPAKHCHRAALDVVTLNGMHRLFSTSLGRAAHCVPIEILHFPDRSAEQLQRAVAKHNDSRKGRKVAFSPRLHLARLYRGRALDSYWKQLLAPAKSMREGRADGRYRTDTRFRDYMRALTTPVPSP